MDNKSKPPAPPWQLRLTRQALRTLSAVSPQLAGRWVNVLWYRTHRIPVRPREQQILDAAESWKLDFGGEPLQCYAWGEGPAVLLVHGWNGRAAQMAPIAAALVKQGFRVVAFDAPAHGESPGHRTELPVISAAIRQLERESGPFRAAVTHSFGGMCLLHAIHEGMQVERAACICPPLDVKTLVDQFATLLQLPDRTLQVHKHLLEKRFGGHLWSRFSMLAWVTDLEIPGLVIHDEQDTYVNVNDGKRIADAWPGSELLVTSGLGHNRILKNRATIDQLADFLLNAS